MNEFLGCKNEEQLLAAMIISIINSKFYNKSNCVMSSNGFVNQKESTYNLYNDDIIYGIIEGRIRTIYFEEVYLERTYLHAVKTAIINGNQYLEEDKIKERTYVLSSLLDMIDQREVYDTEDIRYLPFYNKSFVDHIDQRR